MAHNFRDSLQSILHKHIGIAVENATREAVNAYRDYLTRELGDGAPARQAAPAATEAAGRAKRGRAFGAKMSALLKNRPCPYPDCKNKTRGPRFRFFCAEHSRLPKDEQLRIIAAGKSGHAPAVAAKKAAAKKPVAAKKAPAQKKKPARKAKKGKSKKK